MTPDQHKQFRDRITAIIEKSGHAVIGVGGDGQPSFSYTIGLSRKFGFEVLVIGLPSNVATAIFNDVARQERSPALGVANRQFTTLPVMFQLCDRDLDVLHEEYVCQADAYADQEVPVVQMVLSDREGRLPGEPNFDHAYMGRFQRLFFDPAPCDADSDSDHGCDNSGDGNERP